MSSMLVDVEKEDGVRGSKSVLLFWAPWHEACEAMEDLMEALAKTTSGGDESKKIIFGRVHVEDVPLMVDKYNVMVVPTVMLLDENCTEVERLEGDLPDFAPKFTQAVQRLIQRPGATPTEAPAVSAAQEASSKEDALTQRLERLIRSSDVMLFMKGNPTAPRCGFSRQTVELLQSENVIFGSFDILQDDTVRQGLKKHSNWPTYPQVYVNGSLVGGLDILKELKQEGTLVEQLEIPNSAIDVAPTDQAAAAQEGEPLNERLKKLIRRHRIMLFMKGLPSAPRCGFSRQMVEMLDGAGASYDTFDILQDEEVRQGLKKFSDWPTYPQLYVEGDLIGGLDICKELNESGEFKDLVG